MTWITRDGRELSNSEMIIDVLQDIRGILVRIENVLADMPEYQKQEDKESELENERAGR